MAGIHEAGIQVESMAPAAGGLVAKEPNPCAGRAGSVRRVFRIYLRPKSKQVDRDYMIII